MRSKPNLYLSILNKPSQFSIKSRSNYKNICHGEVDQCFIQELRLSLTYYNNKTSKSKQHLFLQEMNRQIFNRHPQLYPYPWQNFESYYYPFMNPYPFPMAPEEMTPRPIQQKQQLSENNISAINATISSQGLERPTIKIEHQQQQKVNVDKPKIIVKDRNILSNNTNLVLSLIRRPSKSQKRVKNIIEKLNTQIGSKYSFKRFYSYQNYIKQNVNDYRNKNAIQTIICHCDLTCQIYTVAEQLFYNEVCRILINHYLNSTLLLDVLSMTKIKKTNRKDHLKVQRYLVQILKGAKSANFANMYKL